MVMPLAPTLPVMLLVLCWLPKLDLLAGVGLAGVVVADGSVPATSSDDHQPSGREVEVCAVVWDWSGESKERETLFVGGGDMILLLIEGNFSSLLIL